MYAWLIFMSLFFFGGWREVGVACFHFLLINDRDQLFYVYCEREQVLTHSIQCTPPKTECGCPKTVTYATPPMEERRNKERRRKKNLCDTAIIVNSLFWGVDAAYKSDSQHNHAGYLQVQGFVCDMAEQSWAVKAEWWKQCWDWES